MNKPNRRGMHQCLVCRDPRRVEIEASCARGQSKRKLAEQFPPIKADSFWRHWHNHVSADAKEALKVEHYRPGIRIEALVEEEGSGLLTRLQALRGKLQWSLDSASGAQDHKTVSSVAGQLIKLEELAAKATGDLVRHTGRKTVTHVHLTPEFQNLQATILSALRQYPDAYDHVVRVFREREAAERARMLPEPIIEGEVIDARG